MKQIEELMLLSANCQQQIVHNCSVNRLTNYSWWHDRTGQIVTYWHGSNERSAFGCECSLGESDSECDANNNPIGTKTYCNCDSLDNENVDVGLLTNMDQLPVTQLNYGDSQGRQSWIQYELGQFICSGKNNFYPSEAESTNFGFKAAFKTSDDNRFVIKNGQYIQFEDVIYDNSLGSFGPSDEILTAPVTGTYRFTVNLSLKAMGGFVYQLEASVNGDAATIYSSNSGSFINNQNANGDTQIFIFDMFLNRGDKLRLQTISNFVEYENYGDCFTNGRKHDCTTITGALLQRKSDF